MLEQIKEYYKSEYKDVKRVVEQKPWWANPKEVVYNSIQRMLGVAMFAQRVDPKLPYNEIENLFEFYKEEMKNFLTD